MKRKFVIAIAGIVAIVAVGGLNVTAFADEDDWVSEYCERDNSIRAFDFAVSTESPTANAVSGMTLEGKLCGTALGEGETYEEAGSGTQYVHIKVRTASGTEYNSTDAMADGAYVGKLNITTFFWFPSAEHQWAIGTYKLNLLADRSGNGDCSSHAKACYRGVVDPTQKEYYIWYDLYNSVWVTEKNGKHSVHIGEIRSHNDEDFGGVPFGITTIREMTICANAGTNESECGESSQPFVRKNGDASTPGCPRVKGTYKLKARMRDGTKTNAEPACVEWTS